VVNCLEQGADLHIVQLMPLPLTVSCFSKIQIGFTFLVPAHPGSPGKKAVKRVFVSVCVIQHMPMINVSFILQEIKLYRRSEHAEAHEKCSSDTQTANLRAKKNKMVQARQQSAVKVTFHNEAKPVDDRH